MTTVACALPASTTYAIEGSIFIAGAAVQWIRDGLGLVASAGETEAMAAALPGNAGVYLVPAFTGLGRALLGSGRARRHLRADPRRRPAARSRARLLEAVCYQTRDLMEAMAADGAPKPTALRVDGGMTRNDWVMQFLADMLDIPGRAAGGDGDDGAGRGLSRRAQGWALVVDRGHRASHWRRDRLFEPAMKSAERERLYAGWKDAVERVRRS